MQSAKHRHPGERETEHPCYCFREIIKLSWRAKERFTSQQHLQRLAHANPTADLSLYALPGLKTYHPSTSFSPKLSLQIFAALCSEAICPILVVTQPCLGLSLISSKNDTVSLMCSSSVKLSRDLS